MNFDCLTFMESTHRKKGLSLGRLRAIDVGHFYFNGGINEKSCLDFRIILDRAIICKLKKGERQQDCGLLPIHQGVFVMAALPYIQLYVADYLADTAHLTTAEQGAYLLLILNYWQKGKPLNNSNERLANVVRMSNQEWENAKPVLEEFFIVNGDEWGHKRIEADLEAVLEKSNKNSNAGKASAAQRLNGRSTNVQQPLNHKDKDKDKDKDKEEEKKKERAKTEPARKISASFSITDDMRAWAAKEGYTGDINKETANFIDFWLGEGVAKKDWVATWRNRIRKKVEYAKNNSSFPKAPAMLGGLNKRPL